MDSNTNPGAPSDQPTTGGSVMDIQTSQASTGPSVTTPSADMTITPDTAEPVAPPSNGPIPPSGSTDSSQGAPTVHNPMADQAKPVAPQPAKKKSKALVIVVALVVATGLGVAAYFAYMKTMGHKEEAKAPASQTATVTAAKTTDVDDTSKALDTDIASLNDTKDFASTDLADSALGL